MNKRLLLALGTLATSAGLAAAQSLPLARPNHPAPHPNYAIPAYWHDPNLPNGYSFVPNWPGPWSGYPTNNTNPWFPPSPPYQKQVPSFPAFRVVNPWCQPGMGPPQQIMTAVPQAPQPCQGMMMMRPVAAWPNHGGVPGMMTGAGHSGMNSGMTNPHQAGMPGMAAHHDGMPADGTMVEGGGEVVEGACEDCKKGFRLIPRWVCNKWQDCKCLFPQFDSSCPLCPPAFWVRGEYLAWWITDGPVPFPLVTTAPAGSFGFLDDPDTRVLFGGDQDYGTLSGARISMGGWLNYNRTFGLEASGFVFAKTSNGFSAESEPNGEPVLAVPFFDTAPGVNREAVLIASAPGLFVGGVGVTNSTQFWSVEGNTILNLWRGSCLTFDGLLGIRYTDLDEDLDLIYSNLNAFPGGGLIQTDNFSARNQFYGANLGLRAGLFIGRFGLEAVGKCALGVTRETVSIGGLSSFPGLDLIVPGGLFALPSNDGEFHRDAFGLIPEAQLAASWQFHRNLKGLVGYNFLYWHDVVRPGNQMSRNINATQVPGGLGAPVPTLVGLPLPRAQLKGSDFFAHGLSFGLEFDF
jgi:hypothetical protein